MRQSAGNWKLQFDELQTGHELHSAVEPQPKANPQMNTDKHGSVFINGFKKLLKTTRI